MVKESEQTKQKFKSYKEIKSELGEVFMNVETDSEIITRLIEEYKVHTFDKDHNILKIFEDLEYILHQFDNAISFIDLGKHTYIFIIKI